MNSRSSYFDHHMYAEDLFYIKNQSHKFYFTRSWSTQNIYGIWKCYAYCLVCLKKTLFIVCYLCFFLIIFWLAPLCIKMWTVAHKVEQRSKSYSWKTIMWSVGGSTFRNSPLFLLRSLSSLVFMIIEQLLRLATQIVMERVFDKTFDSFYLKPYPSILWLAFQQFNMLPS